MKRRQMIFVTAVCTFSILAGASCIQQRMPISTVTGMSALITATRGPSPAPTMVFRYGLAKLPSELDPHIYSSPELGVLLNNVFETLVYLNEDLKFEPSLAESWQVSADGRSFTFKLHAAVWFHDGTRFNAQAVKENLDRIADPATGLSKAASLLRGYQGAVVLGPHTIRVHFDKPYPAFLDALAQVYLGMASPSAFRMWGRDGYQKRLVGTGPFMFSANEYVPGDTLVLEMNPDYRWGPASYRQNGPLYFGSGHNPNASCQKTHLVHDHIGPAYLGRAIFKAIPDPSARVAALESGAVDAVDGLSLVDATRLQKEGKYWITAVHVLEASLLIDPATAAPIQTEWLERYQDQRQAMEQSLTLSNADSANLNGASMRVNCLSYDLHGWSPYLYDVTLQ